MMTKPLKRWFAMPRLTLFIVNKLLQVNVQVIVPLASKVTTVEQKISVAMGLIQGQVPQIYNKGADGGPSVEVPLQPNEK